MRTGAIYEHRLSWPPYAALDLIRRKGSRPPGPTVRESEKRWTATQVDATKVDNASLTIFVQSDDAYIINYEFMTETHRLEYKSSLTPELDIEKEVIAFLNSSEGGVIFIGVQDNGRILGLSDPDGDMLKLKDRIKNNIVPSAIGLYDLIMDSDNGNHFIKIIVAGGYEKPYFKNLE